MSEKRTNSEQFQLRLPPGLRDRIKAYADAHKRSTNAEIVRVLEREFPGPWSIYDRVDALLELTTTLHQAATLDDGIDKIVKNVEETVEGILRGRVTDVDEDVRDIIAERYDQYRTDINELQLSFDYDEEELEQLERDNTTAKFVDPDFPDIPDEKKG